VRACGSRLQLADAQSALAKGVATREVAIYLRIERSAQFDPQVVDSLLEVVKDLRIHGRSLDDQLVKKAGPSEFAKARRTLGKLLLN
jgi:hypothetical protein